MPDTNKKPLAVMAQQAFLVFAMERVGMTKDAFADRVGASPKLLDRWLAPVDSTLFLEMDQSMWRLIRDVLDQQGR